MFAKVVMFFILLSTNLVFAGEVSSGEEKFFQTVTGPYKQLFDKLLADELIGESNYSEALQGLTTFAESYKIYVEAYCKVKSPNTFDLCKDSQFFAMTALLNYRLQAEGDFSSELVTFELKEKTKTADICANQSSMANFLRCVSVEINKLRQKVLSVSQVRPQLNAMGTHGIKWADSYAMILAHSSGLGGSSLQSTILGYQDLLISYVLEKTKEASLY